MTIPSGTIFLTSTGLSSDSVRKHAESFFNKLNHKKVAIITTAAEDKEKNKYSQLAATQFKEAGFTVIDFIDLETTPEIDLSHYTVLYVCGGNTFKLLFHAKKSRFHVAIQNILNQGGIYIGVSAGSIILSPTIRIADTIDPDPNNINLTDLTGLGIIDFEVLPHYEPEHQEALNAYEVDSIYRVVALSNSNALIITQSDEKLIQ